MHSDGADYNVGDFSVIPFQRNHPVHNAFFRTVAAGPE